MSCTDSTCYEAHRPRILLVRDHAVLPPPFSSSILRNCVANGMELFLFSRHFNEQAEAAIVEAKKPQAQDLPQKQAEQRKKEADDLELTRQMNKKGFEP